MCRSHRLTFAGRLRGRSGQTWLLVIAVLFIVGLIGSVGFWMFRPKGDGATNVATEKVRRSQFIFYVDTKGEIESSNNVEIRCEVMSHNSPGTAILAVVPEGTFVEEGDWLVTLDSSALEQELVKQQIACNTSEAVMIQQRNQYETAVIAKQEYIEGVYLQQEQDNLREIFVAEETLRRAREYAFFSERLAARGYVTALQLEGDLFAVASAENDLDSARTKLRVLQEITKEKNLTQLEADIAINEARWKAEENSYNLDMAKLEEIKEQISNCEIHAPQQGEVVYANRNSSRGSDDFVVEEGALVRERQVLIRLPDDTQMQVKASVNESRIEHVQIGMSAVITVDAIDDLVLHGEVVRVSDYPEPTSWRSSGIKKYAAFIQINDPDQRLRPGLSAKVQIQVEIIDNAVQVPMVAVYENSPNDHYCAVQSGEGWENRRVTIGSMNDNFVVVTENLSEGEVIALSPRSALDLLAMPKIDEVETHFTASHSNTSSSSPSTRPTAETPGSGQQAQARVEQILSRLDKNGDGVIRDDELPDGELRSVLITADTNSDGAIDREELVVKLRSMTERKGKRKITKDRLGTALPEGAAP